MASDLGPVDPKATGFLEHVFEPLIDVDATLRYFLLWTTPKKLCHAFPLTAAGLAEAYAKAASLGAEKENVYFGLGAGGFAPPPSKRFRSVDVTAITCAWIDIDVLDPAHKKKNLPKNLDEAKALLTDFGLEPSLVVRSGHGLQAYWLFREAWILDTPAERDSAEAFLRKFNATFKARAAARGWDVDAVSDLSRVFRVPGTINQKGDPLPVILEPLSLAGGDPLRYNPCELEPYLTAEDVSPGATAGQMRLALDPVTVGTLRLDPAANPDFDKISSLSANDPKFKKTWERKRTDMQDQSQSSYDMALANLGVRAGLTDQEIADIIIAHRRKHGEDVQKALRPDYIPRTILRVKQAVASDTAVAEIISGATDPAPVMTPPPAGGREAAGEGKAGGAAGSTAPAPAGGLLPAKDMEERRRILGLLSKAMKVDIAGWLKHGTEVVQANYTLLLANGAGAEVYIGSSANLFNQSMFRQRVYDVTSHVIPSFKQDVWFQICQALGRVAQVVENAESGRRQQIYEWLRVYFNRTHVHTEKAEAMVHNDPFLDNKKIHIHGPTLLKFLRVDLCQNTTQIELWDRLRILGFKSQTISCRVDSRVQTRTYWVTEQGSEDPPYVLAADEAPPQTQGMVDGGGKATQA